jgi:hypothetical protein
LPTSPRRSQNHHRADHIRGLGGSNLSPCVGEGSGRGP